MPIYEYKCINCGNVFEFLTGTGDKEKTPVCQKCSGEVFQKLVSSSNFTIKTDGNRTGSTARCCGSDVPRDDCVPGMCCGIADKKDI
jgi:putative FmdB family regulatory protein